MKMRSLGLQTDVDLIAFEGEVEDHGDHLSVRSPKNTDYHWGNFLAFEAPPRQGDAERWLERFDRSIASRQPTSHVLFCWDAPDGERGEVEAFLERGFSVEESVVLTSAEAVRPERGTEEIEVRELTHDEEWEQATRAQIACRDMERYSLASYEPFKRRQMGLYRRMVEAGRGAWFGAFSNDLLVGDLGVFVTSLGQAGRSVARYQSVETIPSWRRLGVAATLVYEAARSTQAAHGSEQLVIQTEPGSEAERLYRRVGFEPSERLWALYRRAP